MIYRSVRSTRLRRQVVGWVGVAVVVVVVMMMIPLLLLKE